MLGHSAMVPYDGLAAWIQFHAGGHMAYRRDWKAWLRLAQLSDVDVDEDRCVVRCRLA